MNTYLSYFLNKLDNPPEDISELIKSEKYVISHKGYGTPELEMKYMHNIFRQIQFSHPIFSSFSWTQSNCYNDNYYHIQLTSFTVNEKLYVDSDITFFFDYYENEEIKSGISFDVIDYPDNDEIEFARESKIEIKGNGLDEEYWDAYWAYKKEKYKHIETPCLKMLAFLKLLEINFSMYYFLYVFGNGVEVQFTAEGVVVRNLDENEIPGHPLGRGMEDE
ncbi:MAG TPA: hypothetical protein PK110_10175 [Niabella sp.]|nr:hypothetical protein [Niabella sp.]